MSRPLGDTALTWSLRAAAALSAAVVGLIAVFLVIESLPALRTVGVARFFTDPSWHPTENRYNLTPMLAGTCLAALGAVLIATPIGVASAVFCHDYAPRRIGRAYRALIELLAGIPSVVYGFWGLVVLVPLIARMHPPGPSLLAGSLILAIMILPTIALTADAAIAAVPAEYRSAAAALGLSKHATTRRVTLPAARPGIVTGVILATGRALGETMAVLMVCGNRVQTPASLFDPVRTLTANIALEMAYATDTHRSALFVTGLALLIMIALLVFAAQAVSRGRLYA